MKASLVAIAFLILIGFMFKVYLDYRIKKGEKDESNSIDTRDPKY